MRNPWVHDDVPEAAGPGYNGRIRLLGTLVWGMLFVAVVGFVLLSGAGWVEFILANSLRSIVTSLVIVLALLLVLPLLLKLLAISRLLATIAVLATSGLLGRFLWAREADRIDRFVGEYERLGGANGSIEQLIELLDLLLAML